MLYQEYLNAKRIAEAGIPAPKVYDFIETDSRYGYTMDRLHDETLADLMWKHPWRILEYPKILAAIHTQIHSLEAPKELPVLADLYSEFISSKSSISDEKKQFLLRDIKRLSVDGENRVCHGDYNAMNVLGENSHYSVIDWVLAARGAAAADVAGTYLITRVYSRHIEEKSIFRRFFSAVGGAICAEVYLKEYIAITKMEKRKIKQWIPVKAATYIDVGLQLPLEQIFHRILEKQYK